MVEKTPRDVSPAEPAGVSGREDNAARTFPCDSCGADFTFDIEAQTLRCPFCGFTKEIEYDPGKLVAEQDFHAMLARQQEQRRQKSAPAADLHEVGCRSCGAVVQFQGTLTSSACAYCGSPIQREGVHDAQDRIPVDGVLPFAVEEARARENLRRWVKSRWFLPRPVQQRGIDGAFQSVYLPFWTFDALTVNAYEGRRGEHYYVTTGTGKNRTTVRHTRWYPASGSFRRFFDDVLVLASHDIENHFMTKLEPWPLGNCKPFRQELLAGYLARTYDLPLDQGFDLGKNRIDEALREEVCARIGGDEQQIDWIRTQMPALTYKHLLLPLWLLSYRYKEKTYRVLVNATTGEVHGERPWSVLKITLLVLALALVVGAVVLFSQ